MPDPAARDPHTAVFDAGGILWFTLQRSNMVGRLDPATGNVHGGIVRHMRTTRDGNLLIHQTSTNRIILVTLPQTPATNQARPSSDSPASCAVEPVVPVSPCWPTRRRWRCHRS